MWVLALFKWLNLKSVLAIFPDEDSKSAGRELYSYLRVLVSVAGFMFLFFNLNPIEILVFSDSCLFWLLTFIANSFLNTYANLLLLVEIIEVKVIKTFTVRMFRVVGKVLYGILYRIWY